MYSRMPRWLLVYTAMICWCFYSCQVNCQMMGTILIANSDPEVVDLNDNLILNCSTNLTTDETQLQWSGPTYRPISNNDTRITITNDFILLNLSNISYGDGGMYTCVSTTGNTTTTDTVYVLVRPTVSPITLSVEVGETAMPFTCMTQPSLQSTVRWFMYDLDGNMGEVTMLDSGSGSGSGSGMSPDPHVLDLGAVMFSDAGYYQCAVMYENLTEFSDNATLNVAPADIMVVIQPQRNVFNRGDNVTLTCSALGGPNVYQWVKDGATTSYSQVLEINSLSGAEGGEYTCVVSNDAGSINSSVSFNVAVEIVMSPMNTSAEAGEVATLNCTADGFPAPVYRWSRSDGSNFGPNVTGNDTSVLMFNRVQFGNEGGYYCEADSNGTSVTSDTAVLTVSPGNVVLTVLPDNNVSLGENVTLNCSALGGPNNEFQWLFNGGDTGSSGVVYQLSNVDSSAGGVYTCLVSNTAGNATASITLYVQPYITMNLVDLFTMAGEDRTLTCTAEAFPAPEYQWTRIDGEVPQSASGVNSNSLVFQPVQLGDEGDYFCTATSRGISVYSSLATLNVRPSTVLVSVSPSDTVSRGENVTLNCSAEGGPDNSFQWQKNGADLSGENGTTLQLTSVDASHGGDYTCIVSNAAGNESSNTTLNIRPYITTQPQVLTLSNDGDNATLNCEAMGFPSPSYHWEKVNDSFRSESSSVGDLVFTSLMFGNEGSYECVATVDTGAANFTSRSQPGELILSPRGSVNAATSIENSAPGDVVVLSCSAEGGPGNQFSWTRLLDNTAVGSESNLTVNVNSANDGGDYRCTVSNLAGNESTTVTLNVAPVIDSPPESVNVTSTEETFLTCTVSGFPLPNITWLHNGSQFEEDENRTSVMTTSSTARSITSRLSISTAMVNDSGDYVCNASSSGYTTISSATARVLVQNTPEKPVNVTGIQVTTTSTELQWVEPHNNNAPILGYRVSYTQPGFLGGGVVTVNSSEESVNITGLHPGSDYSFTVVAFNDIGVSAPSDPLMIQTLETAPTAPPQNVSVVVLSSTMMNVSWDEIEEFHRRGNIVMYEVLYEPLIPLGAMIASQVSTNDTFVTLTGLEEFSEYNISVRGLTSAGAGPYSEGTVRRTLEDEPSSPPDGVVVSALSSTSLRVEWMEVPAIDQNGMIVLYEVRYDPLAMFGDLIVQTVNTTNMSTVLTELEEFVEYNISVRAYTSVGPGLYSEGVVNRTLEDVPIASPENLVLMVSSSTTIVANWTQVPAIEQNGIITRYEVRYRSMFDNMDLSQFVNGSTTLTTTLDGLHEFTNYTVSVRAYTSIGPGPYSDNATVQTDQDEPSSPPANVSATVLSSTEIMVSWDDIPEIDQNGIVLRYEVLYQPLTTFGVLVPLSNTTESMSINITGLQEYVEYNISVRGLTSVGAGPYSEGVIMRTLEDEPSSPPDGVVVSALSSTSLRVEWMEVPAFDQNGMIVLYEVRYDPLATFGDQTVQTVNTTNMSIVLLDLEEFVEYNISVRAYTSVGPGPYSEGVVNRTLEAAPSSSPLGLNASVLSSTAIDVSWGEVEEINRNGIITQYHLRFQLLENSEVVGSQMMNLSNETFSASLTGLKKAGVYNISVRALTAAGAGPYSPSLTRQTLEDVPGPVPDPPPPSNDTITSTSVLLSWNEPEDPNGEVISYTINLVAVGLVSDNQVTRRKRFTSQNSISSCVGDEVERNETVPGNQTSVVVRNLTPFVVYEFRVQASTDIGTGNFSAPTPFSTPESVPLRPRNLTILYRSNDSGILNVRWNHPACDNGIRTQYSIEYFPVVSEGPPLFVNLSVDSVEEVLTDLSPNTEYNISVQAWTSVGPGEPATAIGLTMEDAPPRISSFNASSNVTDSVNSVGITLTWSRPSDENGAFRYELSYNGTQANAIAQGPPVVRGDSIELNDTGSDPAMYMFNGLASAQYEFRIYGVNIKTGLAGPATSVTDRTVSIAPTAVTSLRATATSSSSLSVSWNLPLFSNGRIQHYQVEYNEADANIMMMSTTELVLEISDLTPFTIYNITVIAIGEDDLQSPSDATSARTHADIPPPIVVPPENDMSTTTTDTVNIVLPQITFNTGPLKLYAIIMDLNLDNTGNRDYPDIGPYVATAQYYITAAWNDSSEIPSEFVIGTDSITTVFDEMYRNVPLAPGRPYYWLVRVEIQSDTATPLITHSNRTLVATQLPYSEGGLAFGIILIIAVIIAVIVGLILGFLYYRGRYSWKIRGYAENDLELEDRSEQYTNLSMLQNSMTTAVHMGTMEAIPVSEFKAHVQKMHSNDDYLFSEEYANVEPSHSPTTEATHYPHNTAKNRYANIPCYDHSRVRLAENLSRPGSDYINGNYIDGYHQPNAFIATQGPVPDSVNDFWRMIWEQSSATIVMLTNLQEKGRIKCHRYWPEERGAAYGSIRVHLQESLILADYTVRTFSIQKDDSKEERIITQFHYTVWPDHGVPDHPTPLLHFVRKVTSCNPTNAGPIVVHCSAGVGRTGTFITLYSQLKQIRLENRVDVFGFVRSMRYNRCSMVQTELQYVFIHDALLEAIECGVHEVAARDLKEQYKRLGVVDEIIGLTRLELEFDDLSRTVHRRPSKTVGTLLINKSKNRYANVEMVPYDNTRCRLSFIPGVDGSDYINANLIAGYLKRCAFIATQAPLPDTSEDFWRMMWEKQSATIVMLAKEREGGKVRCHRYWPTTGAESYGSLQVILHAHHEYPDYILREFKIVDLRDGSSQPVKQFHYTGWPEEGVPDTGSGFIDLIGQVQKWQRSSGDKPIIVHCSGGTGRTGTFIAVSILLERLKTEGVVDVFHTVRGLRLQRPGMVQTVDQYEFVYKTVLEYLDSFELYANFK